MGPFRGRCSREHLMTDRGRGDIRWLAAASAVSGTGDWAASTALALAVYAKTGSAVWLSVSFLLTRLPSALVALLSGIMADRLDRRRIMITCDLLGAAAYAGMAVTSTPLPLITLGSLAALLHSPFGPASRAAVPNLAGAGDLSWANGTLSAASNVGQLAGPALGGVLYAALGAGPAFWANAASFVASAGCIAAIHGRFRADTPPCPGRGESGGWAGVRFLRRQWRRSACPRGSRSSRSSRCCSRSATRSPLSASTGSTSAGPRTRSAGGCSPRLAPS
jgi:MFS family permease